MFICFVVVTQKGLFFCRNIKAFMPPCTFLSLFLVWFLFFSFFFLFVRKEKKFCCFWSYYIIFVFLAFKFVFSFFSLVLSSSAGCGYFKLFVFRVLNLHKKFKYELGKPKKKDFCLIF